MVSPSERTSHAESSIHAEILFQLESGFSKKGIVTKVQNKAKVIFKQ
jgi:hypothetical protein